MRAVILTAGGTEHSYVSNALIETLGDRVVGIVLESREASIRSALRRYGILRVCERISTKVERRILNHSGRQARALADVLGAVERRWPESIPIYESSSLNSAQTRALLVELAPTHLFVYGTGIVGTGTTRLAQQALNLHTGLSPWYRGSDTEFWPMYYGEPHMVGVTVHDVAPAVDGGSIYARASVQLEPGDDPFLAFARCVRLGSTLYADIAGRLAGGEVLEPVPQDLGVGRGFRFVDRTLIHDLLMDYRVLTGRIRQQIEAADAPLPFPVRRTP